MPRLRLGRIVIAVLAGYLLNGAIVAIVELFFVRRIDTSRAYAADVAMQCAATVVGGIVCCRITLAPQWIAAACMAGLGVVIGTISLIRSWRVEPHWYGITLLAVYAPCV